MKAGRLNQRVTIQQRTNARDAYGGVSITWSDLGTYWAQVKDLSAGEKLASGQKSAWKTREFLFRSGVAISEDMRLNYNSEIYAIHSVFTHPDRIVVQATAGLSDGE